MATLEQIVREAKKLPVEEQRRLRAALEALASNGESEPAYQTRSPQETSTFHVGYDEMRARRLEWLKSHREEYGGQYVALDGDRFLAAAATYRVAREKALATGKSDVFVTYLPKSDEVAEMGGWR